MSSYVNERCGICPAPRWPVHCGFRAQRLGSVPYRTIVVDYCKGAWRGGVSSGYPCRASVYKALASQ